MPLSFQIMTPDTSDPNFQLFERARRELHYRTAADWHGRWPALRGIDQPWLREDGQGRPELILLLPLTDERGAAGLLARLDEALREHGGLVGAGVVAHQQAVTGQGLPAAALESLLEAREPRRVARSRRLLFFVAAPAGHRGERRGRQQPQQGQQRRATLHQQDRALGGEAAKYRRNNHAGQEENLNLHANGSIRVQQPPDQPGRQKAVIQPLICGQRPRFARKLGRGAKAAPHARRFRRGRR